MEQVFNTVLIPREEYDSLVQQRDELLAALKLWKLASDNAEESELDDMACYCVPMPLFCDADEATGAIAAFNKFEGGV